MNEQRSLAMRYGWITIWVYLFVFGSAAIAALPFSTLSPEEQKILAPYAENWALLSDEKQQQLQAGARTWKRMTVEERQQARKQLEVWKQLTPDQQEVIRQRFDQFQQLSPEHRQRLRHVRQEYLELPAASRERLRQDWQRLDDQQREALRQRLLQTEQGAADVQGDIAPNAPHSRDFPSGPAQDSYRGTPRKSEQRGRR
jgi:hypothetical protein